VTQALQFFRGNSQVDRALAAAGGVGLEYVKLDSRADAVGR